MGLLSRLIPSPAPPRATRLRVIRVQRRMLVVVSTNNGGSRGHTPLYGRLDRLNFFKELNRVYYRGHDWRIL